MDNTLVNSLSSGHLAEMISAATQELFSSMIGTDVSLVSDQAERPGSFDGILSLIGLTGAVVGNGALICSAYVSRDFPGQSSRDGWWV